MPSGVQCRLGPDAGQLQDLRRCQGSDAQNHLPDGPVGDGRALAAPVYADNPAVLGTDAVNHRVGGDGEIRPLLNRSDLFSASRTVPVALAATAPRL